MILYFSRKDSWWAISIGRPLAERIQEKPPWDFSLFSPEDTIQIKKYGSSGLDIREITGIGRVKFLPAIFVVIMLQRIKEAQREGKDHFEVSDASVV